MKNRKLVSYGALFALPLGLTLSDYSSTSNIFSALGSGTQFLGFFLLGKYIIDLFGNFNTRMSLKQRVSRNERKIREIKGGKEVN